MDPRLRRNQLETLLKRRIFDNESELYEMMKSRQVYQIQSDLRRELERTMKSIKHAEKLKFAAFTAQRAMFIKRANILERNKRHLTKVQGTHRAACPATTTVERCPKEGLFMTEREETSTSTKLPPVVISHSDNANSDQVIVNQQKPLRGCRPLEKPSALEKTGANVTRNNSILQELKKSIPAQSSGVTHVGKGNDALRLLESPNTQWMEEIKERKAKARARIRAQLQVSSAKKSGRPASVGSGDSSRSNIREGNDPRKDTSIKRGGECGALPKLTLNEVSRSHEKGKDMITNLSLGHDTVKNISTEENASIPLLTKNDVEADLAQGRSVLTHSPSDDQALNIEPNQPGLMTKQNETKIIVQSNDDLPNNLEKQQTPVTERNKIAVQKNGHISENDPGTLSQEGKNTSKLQLLTEHRGGSGNKYKIQPPAGKPPRSHHPFGEISRESSAMSSTSIKEHEREVRRKNLPYFTKVTSSSAKELRKPKSRTISPARSLTSFFDNRERERTITMIFMEDENREALPSAFDIEAWLLYNRKKRGYSIILEPVKKDSENAEKDGDNKKSKKSRLKVSFQNSKQKLKKCNVRSRNLVQKENFRERSQAWYANFLQARHGHNKRRKSPETRGRTWSLPNRRYQHPTLPLLAQSARAATIADGYGWKREVKVLPISKETTETRLKQLKLETETLTNKVHNFVL